ncbi:MAG: peptide-methionine (S)-S-oxide reductase MsrA [Candidatus Nanohaloarchaea archaeon]
MKEATVAGGCFWCVEAALKEVPGVSDTTVGYAGGDVEDPDYEEVCTGETGHAEAVRVEYDPEEITYRELLEVFFSIHDPTTRDREGPDVGSQYRSAVFYHDEEQEETVREVIDELESRVEGEVVTEVEELDGFYPAEEKHQDYFEKHPDRPYCQAHVKPKVEKVRDRF